MTLAEHLLESGLKPADFARRLGVRASTIGRLIKGERGASLELALRIEALTEGKVDAASLARPRVRAIAVDSDADGVAA